MRGARFEVREVRGPRFEIRGKGQSGETNFFFLSKSTYFSKMFLCFPFLAWMLSLLVYMGLCCVSVGSASMTLVLGWVYVYVGSAMLDLYVGLC